jgi:hypothetical protein
MEEHQAQIIELRPSEGLEMINGIKQALGSMTLDHLQLIQADCQRRAHQAHHEAWIVEDVITRRFPDGDAA